MKILIDKKKIKLSEEGEKFKYKLLPLGRFYDERYGWLDFGKERLVAIAKRFSDNIPSYELFITEEHWGTDKIASITKCYFIEEDGLYIEGEIIDNEIFDKFDYMSAELEPYVDKIKGSVPEETLLGCALTNRPANPFVDKIKLSETEEIEVIIKEDKKTEEEEGMTEAEKQEFERIKAENEKLKADKIALSEKGRRDRVEGLKAKWLSEGIAPVTVEKAEKYLSGKEKNGKIHLSEGKEVDMLEVVDDLLSTFERVDLSEVGKKKDGKVHLSEEEELIEIAKEA